MLRHAYDVSNMDIRIVYHHENVRNVVQSNPKFLKFFPGSMSPDPLTSLYLHCPYVPHPPHLTKNPCYAPVLVLLWSKLSPIRVSSSKHASSSLQQLQITCADCQILQYCWGKTNARAVFWFVRLRPLVIWSGTRDMIFARRKMQIRSDFQQVEQVLSPSWEGKGGKKKIN